MEKVKVTLVKSLIGRKKNHIETAKTLGLKKIGDSKIVEKNAAVDGKLFQISYLIKVEAAE